MVKKTPDIMQCCTFFKMPYLIHFSAVSATNVILSKYWYLWGVLNLMLIDDTCFIFQLFIAVKCDRLSLYLQFDTKLFVV